MPRSALERIGCIERDGVNENQIKYDSLALERMVSQMECSRDIPSARPSFSRLERVGSGPASSSDSFSIGPWNGAVSPFVLA